MQKYLIFLYFSHSLFLRRPIARKMENEGKTVFSSVNGLLIEFFPIYDISNEFEYFKSISVTCFVYILHFSHNPIRNNVSFLALFVDGKFFFFGRGFRKKNCKEPPSKKKFT